MKAISLHVPEPTYEALKRLAARAGRPVSELIRQSMVEYLERSERSGPSVLTVKPHRSGRQLRRWTRSELLDEMRSR